MTRSAITRSAITRSSTTIAAALFVGSALTTAAWAQFGSGPLVPPAAPQGMPMPTGGAPNMPGGSPFPSGRLPFANGAVTAVDASAGTITLAPMLGSGTPQIIKVTDATQITATRAGTVGDLKVGDTIQVRGVPTGMTASQITQDDNAGLPMAGMGMVGMGMAGMPPAGPRFGGKFGIGRPNPGVGPAAFAQATGKVTGLSPLTVSVSDSVQVTLRVAPDMKISRTVSEKIGDLKVGDHVMASGKVGDDGALTATRLRVNADFGLVSAMAPAPH